MLKKIITFFIITMVSILTCAVSVSATEDDFDVLDVRDNLAGKFCYDMQDGCKHELWVSNSHGYYTASIYYTTAAVRMKNNEEPPVDGENIIKLSNIQKVNLLRPRISAWFIDADIKLTDDLYLVKGFKSADNTENYCRQLVQEGKADYAQPVETGSYSLCMPSGNLLAYFESSGIEYDKSKLDEISAFDSNLFIFCVNYKNETATLEYLIENVDGFKENIHAITEYNKGIYFQLKSSDGKEKEFDILNKISSMDNFTRPFPIMISYLTDGNKPNQINPFPDYYKAGDVNQNEKVDLQDIISIAEHMIGTNELDEFQQILADYNEDGKVSLMDAIGIATYILENMKK